jgi:hypothetical protein
MTTTGPSSGAAEKPKYHEGKLKPYPHEELGTPNDVSSCNMLRMRKRFLLVCWRCFIVSDNFICIVTPSGYVSLKTSREREVETGPCFNFFGIDFLIEFPFPPSIVIFYSIRPYRSVVLKTPSSIIWQQNNVHVNVRWPTKRFVY